MATAGSNKQGGGSCCKPPPAAADQELDPRYEWQENATSFILRIHLSAFRKQDFRVQVDGAGRLTVRGQRSDAATNPRHSRFSKVFQLPSNSNLDDISGRFEAGVLTITVPKRQEKAKATPAGDAKPPQDQSKAKEDKKPKDDAVAKPKPKDEDATTKKQVADAAKPEPEQQPKAKAAPVPPPAAASRKEEAGKPKAGAAAPAPAADSKSAKPEPQQQPKATAPPPPAARKEEGKPKAGAAAPPPAPAAATDTKKQAATPAPPQADAERKAVDPESLAETVKRRAEEERAKAAAAEAEDERQRKAGRGFTERVAEELQGLAGSEWAEGLVETVKKNKEVIAAAVAAFSLGVFVSSKFFCRSSRN